MVAIPGRPAATSWWPGSQARADSNAGAAIADTSRVARPIMVVGGQGGVGRSLNAPSLRWATAMVTKTIRRGGDAPVADEPPF